MQRKENNSTHTATGFMRIFNEDSMKQFPLDILQTCGIIKWC